MASLVISLLRLSDPEIIKKRTGIDQYRMRGSPNEKQICYLEGVVSVPIILRFAGILYKSFKTFNDLNRGEKHFSILYSVEYCFSEGHLNGHQVTRSTLNWNGNALID